MTPIKIGGSGETAGLLRGPFFIVVCFLLRGGVLGLPIRNFWPKLGTVLRDRVLLARKPPRVTRGQYYQAACRSSGIRCRGYSGTPWKGRRNWNLAPDQIFGPVDDFMANREVVSVFAQGPGS